MAAQAKEALAEFGGGPAPERGALWARLGRCLPFNVRTPDVVEFAGSPQVGQAVLAFARSYSSSGPTLIQRGRAGGTACPTCEALAIERNGSAHFPRQPETAGRHQEF